MEKKLTFVRDLKIAELKNILNLMIKIKYKNRQEFNKLLFKKRKIIFPTRKSISKKSAGNALITISNLELVDKNFKLNSRGNKLAMAAKNNQSKFYRYLANTLLFVGNWVSIINSINKIEKKDVNPLKALRELVRNLISIGAIESGVNVNDMAMRIRGNHIKWLEELGLIKINENGVEINKKMLKLIKNNTKMN
jgi:hypothetical protein